MTTINEWLDASGKPVMKLVPITLTGDEIVLEPLTYDHLPALCEVGLEPEIWKWYTTAPITTPDAMRSVVLSALVAEERGEELPFVIRQKSDGKVVGGTRYLAIDRTHFRLEIGFTWLNPRWQRTRANTEAKFLLLQHAFEVLGCRRVEFKTDSRNEKSRRALLRIGAVEEGTFRNHFITWEGRQRHSVYFSITREEWASTIKEKLQNFEGPTSTPQ